jgi:hypothetical protein
MSGDSPVELVLGVLAAAMFLSLIAPTLNPVTSVNLAAWANLFWGITILGVVALFIAGVRAVSVGGGR